MEQATTIMKEEYLEPRRVHLRSLVEAPLHERPGPPVVLVSSGLSSGAPAAATALYRVPTDETPADGDLVAHIRRETDLTQEQQDALIQLYLQFRDRG